MTDRFPGRIRTILGGLQVISAIALLILIVALMAGTLPSFFGHEGYVVYSGSMEPAIKVGDLAVVAPTRPDQLSVGDVITYRTPVRPDIVVTHRLVGIEHDAVGRFQFETRGDANTTSDQVAVDQEAVLGRVAYVIPRLGYLVNFAQQAEGRVLLIGIPGLLLGLDYLLGMRRRRKGKSSPVRGEAGQLLARGRMALQNGGTEAALGLFDRVIALDPHVDEAWLLKSDCLASEHERVTCLRAGLTVNPTSAKLKEAVDRATASVAVAG